MRKITTGLSVTIALLFLSVPAFATLIGITTNISSAHGSCVDVVVGAGAECVIDDDGAPDILDQISVDIQGSSIVFNFIDAGGDGSFVWSNMPYVFDIAIGPLFWLDDPMAAILSISDSGIVLHGTAEIDGGDLSTDLDGNEITLIFGDLILTGCSSSSPSCASFTIDIEADHDGVVVTPEPTTLALLGLGLAGLGYSRRKSR